MRSYCGKEIMRKEIMVIKYMKRKSWKISMPRTSQTRNAEKILLMSKNKEGGREGENIRIDDRKERCVK